MRKINFSVRPKPEHERVVDVLTELAEDPGLGGPRFQNSEQMMAWRERRIVVIACICERIVGIVIPETRSVEFTSFVTICFGQIKAKLKIGNRESIQETMDSTVEWLRRAYSIV